MGGTWKRHEETTDMTKNVRGKLTQYTQTGGDQGNWKHMGKQLRQIRGYKTERSKTEHIEQVRKTVKIKQEAQRHRPKTHGLDIT